MRYINVEDKNPPEKWCLKAKKLTEKLMNAKTSEERKRNNRQKVYGVTQK